MSWGTGAWGTSEWGGVGTVVPVAPTLLAVSAEVPPGVASNVVDQLGGTILTIVGTNFTDPITIEVMSGPIATPTIVGECYLFDAEFDLTPSRLLCGSPALEDGTYHLRVTTAGGVAELEDAIEARLWANELKTVSVRSKFAQPWATGERFMARGS